MSFSHMSTEILSGVFPTVKAYVLISRTKRLRKDKMYTSFKNERVLTPDELEMAMSHGRKLRSLAFKSLLDSIAHGAIALTRRVRSLAAPSGAPVAG